MPCKAVSAGFARLGLAICLVALVSICHGASNSTEGSSQSSSSVLTAKNSKLLPLDITVNGENVGVWLLIEYEGELYASRDALEAWRVRIDTTGQRYRFRDEEYWPLRAVAGYKSKVDFGKMAMNLEFAAESFAETRLDLDRSKRSQTSPTVASLQLNYSLNYQRSDGPTTTREDSLGAAVELALSTSLGVLTTSAVANDLLHRPINNQPLLLRLETTFTRDFPDRNQTLVLGDTSTRQGTLGASAFFGGIRIGSNFSLTPGFISRPVPVLTGSSLSPSTVSLYINDVLRQTSNVPSGRFTIDHLPSITGAGDARLIIRDVLGRETVITQSFFSDNRMLAPGLNDWSFEAGSLRRSIGTEGSGYGPLFARGFWRRGYSEDLTLEGIAEVTPDLRKFNAGLQTPFFGLGLASASLAASDMSSLGSGRQWLLGLEMQHLHGGVVFQNIGSSRNFRELGQNMATFPIRQQTALTGTYATPGSGSLGLGYTTSSFFDREKLVTRTASYSNRIGPRLSYNLSYSETAGAIKSSLFAINLLFPLEGGTTFAASTNSGSNGSDFYVSASGSQTMEQPLSWRVLAGSQQGTRREEGGVAYFGRYGDVTADVSNSQRNISARISANSGLIYAGGELFATRRTTGSYALAEVEGYPNIHVGIGSSNDPKTNANGYALIPGLSPYHPNSIRLKANDLPVSAQLESIEQTVVPAWRSVALAKFPVRSGRAAMFEIRFDDGNPAPAGATVRIDGDKEEFFVARKGLVYITGLQSKNRLMLNWNDHKCSFELALPPTSPDDIPRLPPVTCSGIKR